jgi:hypothetical protein
MKVMRKEQQEVQPMRPQPLDDPLPAAFCQVNLIARTECHIRLFTVKVFWIRVNDPSAGSPTETLLRLLLPLSVKVH